MEFQKKFNELHPGAHDMQIDLIALWCEEHGFDPEDNTVVEAWIKEYADQYRQLLSADPNITLAELIKKLYSENLIKKAA